MHSAFIVVTTRLLREVVTTKKLIASQRLKLIRSRLQKLHQQQSERQPSSRGIQLP